MRAASMRMAMLVMAAALAAGQTQSPLNKEIPPITDKHYKVFRGDGTAATLDDVVAASRQADVTFLGESHDDAVAHHLQLEIFKRVAEPGGILSLEMFETDVQGVVDEYLAGLITADHLLTSGRAWRNYNIDYKPLVEFAKEKKLAVVAANAPRRYVNRVSRMGKQSLEALPKASKKLLPPLPYAEPSAEYEKRFDKVMEEGRRAEAAAAANRPPQPPRDPRWGVQAQSLWDASMAYSIARALKKQRGGRVIHLNGSFHSEQRQGIPEHLARYRKGVKMLVVTMRPEESFPEWNAEKLSGAGDFVIVTDPKLPRSYSSPPPPAAAKPAGSLKPAAPAK